MIHKEPDWRRLPPGLPLTVAIYLRRCLQKDARQRVQAAGDMRLALEGAYDASAVEIAGRERVRDGTAWGGRARLPFIGVALLLGGLTAGSVIPGVSSRASAPLTRFTVTFPDGAVTISGAPRLAVSADGRTLIYGGRGRLYRRNFDNFTETAIDGSEGGTNPVLSPDGRWVAFARFPGDLFKVPLEGGPASPIVRGLVRGFSWIDDGSILFGTNQAALSRVSSNGGNSQPVTTLRPGEIAHRWPDVLPGNTAAVFTVWRGSPALSQIAIASLVTGEHRVLFEGVYARYSSTGHLVFVQNAGLWGVAFDPSRLETVGNAVPVVSDLPTTPDGAAQFALGRDGTLAYEPEFGNDARTLAWVDRQGRETPLATPPRRYALPRISPDGSRVAAQIEGDIWIWDTIREVLTRLTVDTGNDTYPLWTPDSRRLVFTSDRAGPANLFIQAADGSGDAERLTNGSTTEYGHAFTPDGRRLVFRDTVGGGGDIVALSMEARRDREWVLASQFQERNPDLSPDGRWMAYESNASGQLEVYVRPFPNVNEGLLQVSVSGGLQPRWGAAGRELFYVDLANRLMVASFDASRPSAAGTVAASPPKVVVDLEQAGYIIRGPGRDYDVSADGSRVLVLKAPANRNEGGRVFVVQNWQQELKRLVPAN